MIPLSILDLVTVSAGKTPGDALRASIELAQHAEKWGYQRYWVAEHHGMPNIASSATAVVIGQLAAATRTLRVGSGGIMLPNHAPLIIAEQFGTLESLFPGRIDLGLGRAPGTDMLTACALRRDPLAAENFMEQIAELLFFFATPDPHQPIQAVPGAGLTIPLWMLGSSLAGAHMAAELGLPYAFASHFAPEMLMDALALYRQRFQPSEQLSQPYTMAGLNMIVAYSDEEARYQFTTLQQSMLRLIRGGKGLTPPPVETMDGLWSPTEKANVTRMLTYSVVGSARTAAHGLQQFMEKTQVDEVMIASHIYDPQVRLRSYEMIAEIMRG